MIYDRPTDKFEGVLKPSVVKNAKPYRIITFDTEDDSEGNTELGDFFDGTKHTTFDLRNEEGKKGMVDFFYQIKEPTVFVAHNLEYDINNVFRDFGYKHIKRLIYVQRLIKAELVESEHILWDSFNWYATSLANMAKVVGEVKGDWAGSRAENEEKYIEYLHGDTRILWKFVNLLQESCLRNGAQLRATIARMAMDSFLANDLSESYKSHSFRCTLNSYYGGRTEAFYIGKCSGDIRVLDVRSMYPTQMSKMKYPDTNMIAEGMIDDFKFGYGHFRILVPDMPIPPLPVKYHGKLIFPVGEIEGWWVYDEVRMAVSYGCKILRQYAGYGTDMSCEPFKSYIERNYGARAESRRNGDEFGLLYYKLMMNSLYGKYCQHSGGTELATELPKDMKGKVVKRKLACFYVIEETEEAPAKTANFLWGAYITAYSRMYLYDGIQKVMAAGHKVLYCDTDSVFVQMNGDAMPLVMGEELGQWDEEKFLDINISTVKAYQMTARGKWAFKLSNKNTMVVKAKTKEEAEALAPEQLAKTIAKEGWSPDTTIVGVNNLMKIACKGVPSAYKLDFLNTGEADVRKPVKLKEGFIQGLKANVWRDVKKKMKTIYGKREVFKDGETAPLKLTMKRGVDYSAFNSKEKADG